MNSNQKLASLACRFEKRQGIPKIGTDYVPAIKAVRGEAPSMSRCSRIYAPRIGREIHCLSSTEAVATVVALFHPKLVDLLEQRCLPVGPTCHPISLYLGTGSAWLPNMQGTVAVAERLGLSKFHPKFICEDVEDRYVVPLNLVGDHLLILSDEHSLYAVNWTVKFSEQGFSEDLSRKPLRRMSTQAMLKAEARHRTEEQCYGDAGIPTYRVTQSSFDKIFVANLFQSFGWVGRQINVDELAQAEIIETYRSICGTELTPLDLLDGLCRRYMCNRKDCMAVFHQAIWERKLRIDLFRPVVFDAPIQHENIDPIARYESFFARGAK